MTGACNFFRSRLDQMIDLRRPRVVLALCMPWQEISASDLFDTVDGVLDGGVSPAGRPLGLLRLMIARLLLKRAFYEVDEGVVEGRCKTPNWQCFTGHDCLKMLLPRGSARLVRFQRSLSDETVEALLA